MEVWFDAAESALSCCEGSNWAVRCAGSPRAPAAGRFVELGFDPTGSDWSAADSSARSCGRMNSPSATSAEVAASTAARSPAGAWIGVSATASPGEATVGEVTGSAPSSSRHCGPERVSAGTTAETPAAAVASAARSGSPPDETSPSATPSLPSEAPAAGSSRCAAGFADGSRATSAESSGPDGQVSCAAAWCDRRDLAARAGLAAGFAEGFAGGLAALPSSRGFGDALRFRMSSCPKFAGSCRATR